MNWLCATSSSTWLTSNALETSGASPDWPAWEAGFCDWLSAEGAEFSDETTALFEVPVVVSTVCAFSEFELILSELISLLLCWLLLLFCWF